MAKGVEVKVGVVKLYGVMPGDKDCSGCDFQDHSRDFCLLFDKKIRFVSKDLLYYRCKACRDAEVKP